MVTGARLLVVQHRDIAHLGTLRPHLRALEVHEVRVDRGEAVPDLTGYAGVVVLGGLEAAYTDTGFPTRRAELDLARQAVAEEVPYLGICLGAQLLAVAHGGEGYRGPVSEAGWAEVVHTEAAGGDLLHAGAETKVLVPASHDDHYTLPQGAVLLGRGHVYENQAYRLGKSAWGVQYHPEGDETWLRTRVQLLSSWNRAASSEGLPPSSRENLEALAPFRDQLFSRFARIVAARGELPEQRNAPTTVTVQPH